MYIYSTSELTFSVRVQNYAKWVEFSVIVEYSVASGNSYKK